MSKREQREREIKNKKEKANYDIMYDALTELLLIDILTGDDQYKLEKEGLNKLYIRFGNEFQPRCVLVAEEYEFKFLGINNHVNKNMHEKYKLHQNWYFFRDVEGLMDMFKRCVMGFK
jgi:hypothetical protein